MFQTTNQLRSSESRRRFLKARVKERIFDAPLLEKTPAVHVWRTTWKTHGFTLKKMICIHGGLSTSILVYRSEYKSISGWWFQPTPLKNDGVRQLG